jgi:hypothetical protein
MSNGHGKASISPVYIARVINVADEISSFPDTTDFMPNQWGHFGGKADGGTITLSGSGTYQLYSISMGKQIASPSNVPTITMRVYSGYTASSGALVSSQDITYPDQTDTSSPYQCQELVFPTPVTLNRGTTYAVAYGMTTGLGVLSGGVNGTGTHRTSYSVSSTNGGGTLSFGNMDFADSDPFDTTNGTGFTYSRNKGNGQLPVFGFLF